MRIFRAIALTCVVSFASVAAFILGAWIVTKASPAPETVDSA